MLTAMYSAQLPSVMPRMYTFLCWNFRSILIDIIDIY